MFCVVVIVSNLFELVCLVQVVDTPEISAALEEFSRKALCQESVLFLQEAAT